MIFHFFEDERKKESFREEKRAVGGFKDRKILMQFFDSLQWGWKMPLCGLNVMQAHQILWSTGEVSLLCYFSNFSAETSTNIKLSKARLFSGEKCEKCSRGRMPVIFVGGNKIFLSAIRLRIMVYDEQIWSIRVVNYNGTSNYPNVVKPAGHQKSHQKFTESLVSNSNAFAIWKW